jgi:hypothetical protein
LFGDALAAEIGRRHGAPVELMEMKHGVFDEGAVSVITSSTCDEVCRLGGSRPDVRRFRPNIVVRSKRAVPFEEDEWVGGVLRFGEADDAPAVAVTLRDERCVMMSLDPDAATAAPALLKAVVRANQNHAGIYGAVTRAGRVAVGQTLFFTR